MLSLIVLSMVLSGHAEQKKVTKFVPIFGAEETLSSSCHWKDETHLQITSKGKEFQLNIELKNVKKNLLLFADQNLLTINSFSPALEVAESTLEYNSHGQKFTPQRRLPCPLKVKFDRDNHALTLWGHCRMLLRSPGNPGVGFDIPEQHPIHCTY